MKTTIGKFLDRELAKTRCTSDSEGDESFATTARTLAMPILRNFKVEGEDEDELYIPNHQVESVRKRVREAITQAARSVLAEAVAENARLGG